MKYDIVVVGGANFDYLVRGPRLPAPGDTVEGKEFQEAPGGKGANQAVAAARLGAHVAFIAKLGRDNRGDLIMDRLSVEGVDTRHVVRDPEAVTGVALVLVDERGQKQIFTAPGANCQLTVADIQKAAAVIGAARVLLTQLETPLDSVITAVRLGHEAQAQIILDPAPPIPLPDELLRLIEVIKPNSDEAKTLTGVQVEDRASARTAAKQLLERGVKAVAIQAGEAGNLLVWHEGESWHPKLPVKSIDATGAGDAFAAALAVALVEGRSWPEAGAWANSAAALKTTALGAQAGLPRREAVQALLAQFDREDQV